MDVSKVMTRLWSPVTVVTSNFQGRVNGQVAVSVSAASIVPDMPRVLVQIYKANFSHALILDSGICTVNFLSDNQVEIDGSIESYPAWVAGKLSLMMPEAEKFGLAWRLSEEA